MIEWITSDGRYVGMLDENSIYNIKRNSKQVIQTEKGPAFPISEDVVKKLRKKKIKRIIVSFGN